MASGGATQALRETRFATVVGRLTGANALIYLFAFVTSPILARTLGPSGRGNLAAITVVVVLAPTIADVGLFFYVARERARRVRRLGYILGSVVPVALTASMVGVLLAVPIAHLLGHGRPEVVFFIELGLFMLPLAVFLQTLYGVALGGEQWGRVLFSKLVSSGGAALVIVALSLAGRLSVATAAVGYLATGLVANLLFLRGLRASRPWRFRPQIAREGLKFGSQTWLSVLATQGNARLDQLMMAAVLSSSELGLYALAVTIATASSALIGAVGAALVPRVASGEAALAARACRMTILVVCAYGVVVALVSPVAIPLVFGSAFSGTVPMLVVLLAANIFLVPSQVLGSAIIAAGDPGASARSQALGLVITVPGLVVVLPLAGGLGAAWISLLSYGVSFLVVFVAAIHRFGLGPKAFLFISASDLQWLRTRLRSTRTGAVSAASPT